MMSPVTAKRSLAGLLVLAVSAAGCSAAATHDPAAPHRARPDITRATPSPSASLTTMHAEKPKARAKPKLMQASPAPVQTNPAPVQPTPVQTGPAPSHSSNPIPQNNGGDHDGDNSGGPSDGDGNI